MLFAGGMATGAVIAMLIEWFFGKKISASLTKLETRIGALENTFHLRTSAIETALTGKTVIVPNASQSAPTKN